jgi:hypothetical protein
MAATWEDVSAIARELPAAEQGVRFGDATWKVGEGFPAILIALDHVDLERLREVVTDAWLARAPKRLAAEFLANDAT